MKPALFIGSSREGLSVARAVQENLDDCAEVTVWDQGVFRPTHTNLQSLFAALDQFDFAAFVFSDDDVAQIRDAEARVVRDNVVFEFGLFLGHLGQDRTFFVVPADAPELHLPTDLLGVTPLMYDTKRKDGSLRAALGKASNQIRTAIDKLRRPFDDELYEWLESLEGRIRRLLIRRITRCSRATDFPRDRELSKLPWSELVAAYELAEPPTLRPEAVHTLMFECQMVGRSLYRGRGGEWESAGLRQQLDQLEKQVVQREQAG